jgi:hypothetical protein
MRESSGGHAAPAAREEIPMGLIPDSKVGKIEFCENHVTPWTTNAVAMGSSAAAVTDWSAKTTAARAAYQAQQAAQSAAKDATNDLNVALDALMVATGAIIKQVRAKADMSGNSIYSLASLPVPPTPTPMPPPGKPTDLLVTLSETGALTLTWKCPNPTGSQGTIYQIWRRTSPTAAFEYLGGAGSKLFVDETIPAGSSQVTYQIQGARSTAVGEFAQFNVNFGVNTGGEMTASVSEGDGDGPAKIAA